MCIRDWKKKEEEDEEEDEDEEDGDFDYIVTDSFRLAAPCASAAAARHRLRLRHLSAHLVGAATRSRPALLSASGAGATVSTCGALAMRMKGSAARVIR